MGGRETDIFLQISAHLLFLTPLLLIKLYFLFPSASPCDPCVFLSLEAALKSFRTEVCDSLSLPASSQLFAASFLSKSLTILPTQQACFGLIFSRLLACFNLLLQGLEASAYCKIVWVMDLSAPPPARDRPMRWLSFCSLSSASKSLFKGWTQIHFWFFFFCIKRHKRNHSLMVLFTVVCCFSGDGQPVCLCFLKDAYWKDLGGKFFCFEDWEPGSLPWDNKNWVVDVGSWDLLKWQLEAERNAGDWFGVSFQNDWNKQDCLPPTLLVSQRNVMSWFTSLKITRYLFGCSELPKPLVCLLKSKSSSHLHQSDFFPIPVVLA